jgi:hypothetical protein
MVVAWIWDLKQSVEGALTASDGKQFQIRLETGENSSQEAHFLLVSKKTRTNKLCIL